MNEHSGEHRPPDEVWIGDEAFRLAAENKRLTALVKDAAWQLNEALSMLQEAERRWSRRPHHVDRALMPHYGAALAEALAEIQRLREALRRACVDGFADADGAMRFYLAAVGARDARAEGPSHG